MCNQFPVLWECIVLLGQAYSSVQSFPKVAGLVCIHFPGILGIYRLAGTVILQSVTHRLWTKLKDRVKAHLIVKTIIISAFRRTRLFIFYFLLF